MKIGGLGRGATKLQGAKAREGNQVVHRPT